MGYGLVLATVMLTVYGQVMVKWQVLKAGALPEAGIEKLYFLLKLTANPWVLSAYAAALLASLCWMAAMTKLQLSHAYPFMSLNFVLVLGLSALLFHEALGTAKLVGLALIIVGLIVGSQG